MRGAAPALLLVALWAAPAAGQTRNDGRQLLDDGAALVVRGDPDELERLATLARSLGGDVSQVVNLASIGSAGALGFDLLSRAGWPVVGLDPGRPLFVQVSPAAGGLRHARAVAAIGEPADFTAWSRRIPALDRRWIAQGDKGDLAALLGIKGAPADAARALGQKKVEVVGWSSVLKVYAFLRRDGAFMVLDLFAVRGRALDWTRDGAQVLARLGPPKKSMLSRRGVADWLGKKGVALWTRPGGVFDLLAGPAERACGDLAPASRGSGLIDLVVSLRRDRARLEVAAAYGLADATPLVAALATADDRLSTNRSHDLVAATLYTGNLEKLRELPRDSAIRAGWVPLWRRVRDCGRAIRAELSVFAWPELLGQWLDEAADLSPAAASLVTSVRNVGVAAKSISIDDIRASVAFAEVSMVDRGKPAAESLVDALFGARRAARRPQRHTSWGERALKPYLLGPRGLSFLGVALGEKSLAWRMRKGRASRSGKLLGAVSASGGELLRQIAPALPPRLAPIGRAAAGRVRSVRGDLTLSRSVLALALSIELR